MVAGLGGEELLGAKPAELELGRGAHAGVGRAYRAEEVEPAGAIGARREPEAGVA